MEQEINLLATNAGTAPGIPSAHAVLTLGESDVLQLRDDKGTIAAPGKWSLFGGRIRCDETALQTIKREICEELAIKPNGYCRLWFANVTSQLSTRLGKRRGGNIKERLCLS